MNTSNTVQNYIITADSYTTTSTRPVEFAISNVTNERLMYKRGEEKLYNSNTTAAGNEKKLLDTKSGSKLIADDLANILAVKDAYSFKYKPNWYKLGTDENISTVLILICHSAYMSNTDIKWSRHALVKRVQELIKDADTPAKALALIEWVVRYSSIIERVKNVKDSKTIITYELVAGLGDDLLRSISYMAGKAFYPLPMTTAPIDWTYTDTGFKGGYSTKQFPIVRGAKSVEWLKDEPNLLLAVNTMQQTPYRVNKIVLEAIKADLKEPVRSEIITQEYPISDPEATAKEVKKLKAELLKKPANTESAKKALNKKLEALDSRKFTQPQLVEINEYYRQDANYMKLLGQYRADQMALDIAEAYQNEKAIYFPCNFDYRGRMYPISVYLQPQGNEKVKALLEFAEGVQLTESGAEYAYYTLAGLYGEDKKSFNERVEIGKIVINSNWKEADEPYQFLALQTQLLEWEKDPTTLIHTPAHLDGSCNGSQHAAALTGCKKTAEATNVLPMADGSRRDVYLEVANEALKLAQEQDTEVYKYIADCLVKAGRKFAKKPVMISVYGGTSYGFADDVFNNMKELNDHKLATKGTSFVFAGLLIQALNNTLAGGKVFESWIQSVGSNITATGNGVTWSTPDGFNVTMDRKIKKSKRYETLISGVTYKIQMNVDTEQIDAKKIKQAISPNYVHSCDATHLRATMLNCARRGVKQFNFIHDSFGCNMNDAHILLEETKKAWIDLYDGFEVGKYLQKQLQEQSQEEVPDFPYLGGYNIKSVTSSEYFFA